ncbi:MAG: hypothetical protein ACR2KK_04990 [Acidimicrobiales bacterium]
MGRWFRDPVWPKRLVAVLALVALSAVVLLVVAWMIGFPKGFNEAQSASGRWLETRPDQWRVWRRTATRDLLLFVPAYVGLGTAAICWATARRPFATWPSRLLVLGGIADIVETLLFRRTLDRLIDGATGAELSTVTGVTSFVSGLKLMFLGLAVAGLILGTRRAP